MGKEYHRESLDDNNHVSFYKNPPREIIKELMDAIEDMGILMGSLENAMGYSDEYSEELYRAKEVQNEYDSGSLERNRLFHHARTFYE